jgi:hypothetical protein
MLGERGAQRGLFEADTLYGDFVGHNTFYGFLAAHRGELFRDADFAMRYCLRNGRPSVPPSLLATAMVLQTYDGVSDEEAKRRADYDLQWKVALGIALDARPFAKSTLQEFRAQLIVHAQAGVIFQQSLELAKRHGFFQGKRKLKVALDTTNILGRGAVKDTYNLLADGIRQVLRVLATQAAVSLVEWAESRGFRRYVSGGSLKGPAELEWNDPTERRRFLQGIVGDADRLLGLVREARGCLAEGSPEDTALVEAAGLLSRVLVQAVERKDDGSALRQGVAEDRMPALHDPEMRHGRKSASKRFDGHKAAVAVDTDSQLITAAEVLPGNAPDAERALELVEHTQTHTGCLVEAAIGDCAYGAGDIRQAFSEAGHTLIAKVPAEQNQGRFTKRQFHLDLAAGACTCPAGHTTYQHTTGSRGGQLFQFATAVCEPCPLRRQCTTRAQGRTVWIHPQEALLQAARELQASPAFREYRTRRQVVEHRLARLVQLGIRQARYVGRAKTHFQLLMAAAVANLTRIASATSWTTPARPSNPGQGNPRIAPGRRLVALLLSAGRTFIRSSLPRAAVPNPSLVPVPMASFRPRF